MTVLSKKVAMILGLSLLLVAPPGMAKSKSKSKKKAHTAKRTKLRLESLDTKLAGLKFGGDEAAALKWVRLRFQHHYDPLIAKASGVDKERLKDVMEVAVAKTKKNVVEYKSGKTGFETSIVAKDYGRVPGERMMVAKVGQVEHYLLFHKGRLWRYAASQPQNKTFTDRVAQYTRRVGKPVVERTTPKAFAGWIFKGMRLELRDQRVMFGGDTLVLSHRGLSKALSVIARKFSKATKSGDDPDLKDVIDTTADKAPDTSAADKELEEYERNKKKKKRKKKRKK